MKEITVYDLDWISVQGAISLNKMFGRSSPLFRLEKVLHRYVQHTATKHNRDGNAYVALKAFLRRFIDVLQRIDSIHQAEARHLEVLLNDWLALIGVDLAKEHPKEAAILRKWVQDAPKDAAPKNRIVAAPPPQWDPEEAIEIREVILGGRSDQVPSARLKLSKVKEARQFANSVIRKAKPSPDVLRRLDSLLPSIRIHGGEAMERLPVGMSHFAGNPDLPPDWKWPVRDLLDPAIAERIVDPKDPRHVYRPLGFLAQFNLKELPPRIGDLPTRGMLYFFCDLTASPMGGLQEDRGCMRVLYYDGDLSKLETRLPPADLDELSVQRYQPITFTVELTPEQPFKYEMHDEEYAALDEKLIGDERSGHCRLLGHPQLRQFGDMRETCELLRRGLADEVPYGQAPDHLVKVSKDWILLCQIDSEGTSWDFGNAGCVYFWIRKQDLKARRFEEAIGILQV